MSIIQTQKKIMVVLSVTLPLTLPLGLQANNKRFLMIQLFQLSKVFYKDTMGRYSLMVKQERERHTPCKVVRKSNSWKVLYQELSIIFSMQYREQQTLKNILYEQVFWNFITKSLLIYWDTNKRKKKRQGRKKSCKYIKRQDKVSKSMGWISSLLKMKRK